MFRLKLHILAAGKCLFYYSVIRRTQRFRQNFATCTRVYMVHLSFHHVNAEARCTWPVRQVAMCEPLSQVSLCVCCTVL